MVLVFEIFITVAGNRYNQREIRSPSTLNQRTNARKMRNRLCEIALVILCGKSDNASHKHYRRILFRGVLRAASSRC